MFVTLTLGFASFDCHGDHGHVAKLTAIAHLAVETLAEDGDDAQNHEGHLHLLAFDDLRLTVQDVRVPAPSSHALGAVLASQSRVSIHAAARSTVNSLTSEPPPLSFVLRQKVTTIVVTV